MSYQIIKNDQPVLYKGESLHAFDMVSVVKSVNMDKRTLSMIGSTEARDRDGDRIMVAGWDLKDYVKNPVFIWAHDYNSVPLAATGKVTKRKSPNPHLFFKDIRFPKAGIFPFADMILDLYNEKIINASSVGFLPTDFEEDEVDEKDQSPMMYRPMLFKKQKLLELSGVAVPSNPEALQNSMKSVIGKHFGKEGSQEADIIKAMVEGAVPTDKQYDDLMNELNIQKIEVEEERKVQIQVPKDIDEFDYENIIKKDIRWNKSLPKVFDVSAEEFSPASSKLELYSKYLEVPVKEIIQRDIYVPSPMIGTYLVGVKHWIDSNCNTKDIRNLSYRNGERPPVYDDVQLTSKDQQEFLIIGTEFLERKDKGIIVDRYPVWGGMCYDFYVPLSEKEWLRNEIKSIHKWVKDNPLLKGEKFALNGEFIQKTEETFDDVILEDSIQKNLDISLKIVQGNKDSRGIMTVGPPGTGKTMLGKAIKNTTDSTFIWISASDFSRVGASSGLSLAFKLSRQLSPTILFIEDIDGWANGRAIDILKGEMDGLKGMKGVLTILTSNNPTTFPKSLIDRPGRFHDIFVFDLPNRSMREKMINKWIGEYSIDKIFMQKVLEKTKGFSGAHIKDLIQFAIAIADSEEKDFDKALQESLDKILTQRELISTLPNYDSRSLKDENGSNFSKSLDLESQQPVTQAEKANGDEGDSDVLDHIMNDEKLPQPDPKKGFNQKSIQELSDTISKLKAVLNS